MEPIGNNPTLTSWAKYHQGSIWQVAAALNNRATLAQNTGRPATTHHRSPGFHCKMLTKQITQPTTNHEYQNQANPRATGNTTPPADHNATSVTHTTHPATNGYDTLGLTRNPPGQAVTADYTPDQACTQQQLTMPTLPNIRMHTATLPNTWAPAQQFLSAGREQHSTDCDTAGTTCPTGGGYCKTQIVTTYTLLEQTNRPHHHPHTIHGWHNKGTAYSTTTHSDAKTKLNPVTKPST